jgi:hypothetical protein
MRIILTIVFILTTLCSIAGGLDSTQTMMLNKTQNREINLHLRSSNKELSTNGFLTSVSGLGFTTIGILLEQKRIQQNIPDGYFGYSKSNDMGLNYFINSLGVGMTITGVIMIKKAYKR